MDDVVKEQLRRKGKDPQFGEERTILRYRIIVYYKFLDHLLAYGMISSILKYSR